MKRIIYTLVALVLSGTMFAQTVDFGKPESLRGKYGKPKAYHVMPSVDADAQIIADEQRRIDGIDKVFRFGVEHPTSVDVLTASQKKTMPNGDVIYQYGIHCPGALSINLIFDQFELATGAHLYLVAENGESYAGAYTSLNNNVNKVIGTELVYDEKAIIELVEPKSVVGKSRLHLGTVVHGYRNLDLFMEKTLGQAGACNVDVNCPLGQGWEDQRNATACVVSGGGICSGSLVNNTSGTIIPYYLTANHCGTLNTAAWVFRFRWERTAATAICAATNSTNNNGPTNMTITGCTLRANNSSSDFILVELNTAPNPAWGIYYNGWDHSDALTVSQATGIHHPSGDIKKICRENDAPTQIITSFNGNPTTNEWQIANWDNGVTEPGSSGSPLFDQNHRTIGVLSGGASACSGTTDNNQYDIYGRFGTAWNLGATPATRLQDWLDPYNTGAVFIDGVNPAGNTTPIDGGIQNLEGISGNICGASVTPEFSIFNAGTENLTSLHIAYGIDGNTNLGYDWTGNLAQYQSVIITLPLQQLTSGNHTFSAQVTTSNGATDVVAVNNSLSSNFTIITDGEVIDLNLNLDYWASEISWQVLNNTNTVLYTSPGYADANSGVTTLVNSQFCLSPGCYTFKIMDTQGDGMTSTTDPSGSYTITNNAGTVLAAMAEADANFGTSNATQFCVSATDGISEYLLENSIHVFPNPASEFITVSASNNQSIDGIRVVDISGKEVRNLKVGANSFQLNIANLSKGMYILQIQTSSGTVLKEMVIHH